MHFQPEQSGAFLYCDCTIKHVLSNHNSICFCVCCCAFSILISNYTIYWRKYCLGKGPSCYLKRIWRVNCACVYQRVSTADEQMFMLMRGALGMWWLRSRWDEIGMASSALQSRLLWVACRRWERVSVESYCGGNERFRDEWEPVEALVFTLNISSLIMTNPRRCFGKKQPGGPHSMTYKNSWESTTRHLPSVGGRRRSLIPGEIYPLSFSLSWWQLLSWHNLLFRELWFSGRLLKAPWRCCWSSYGFRWSRIFVS